MYFLTLELLTTKKQVMRKEGNVLKMNQKLPNYLSQFDSKKMDVEEDVEEEKYEEDESSEKSITPPLKRVTSADTVILEESESDDEVSIKCSKK